MTYICAGKGSPGLRGFARGCGGVAAEVGRRTPHPSTISVSLLVSPTRSSCRPAPRLIESFSSPPDASCAGKLGRQAGSGAGLFGGQVCVFGGDTSAFQYLLRPRPCWVTRERRGGRAASRGRISFGCSFLLVTSIPTPVREEEAGLRRGPLERRKSSASPLPWVLAEPGRDLY